ncbi:MAG: hypothetical protein OHK005_18500 [Candidatus Methylacidiphilales bacterium]
MAWLRLMRLPGWLTVPGDVLVGFWLAGGFGPLRAEVVAAVLAGLGIYAMGLLVNDWADREEDRRLRTDRPLARGEIGMGPFCAVLGVLWIGSLVALGVAGVPVLVVGVCLMSLAISYSLVLRRWMWLGVVALGLCRVGLVMMGVLAAGVAGWTVNLGLACGTVFGWIVLVSVLARDEVGRVELRPRFHPRGLAAYLLAVGVAWLVVGEFRSEVSVVLFVVLGLILAEEAWRPAGRYWAVARERPSIIGQWLGLLIPMQVWLILPTSGWVTGLGMIVVGAVLWGIRGWLVRWFAAS